MDIRISYIGQFNGYLDRKGVGSFPIYGVGSLAIDESPDPAESPDQVGNQRYSSALLIC